MKLIQPVITAILLRSGSSESKVQPPGCACRIYPRSAPRCSPSGKRVLHAEQISLYLSTEMKASVHMRICLLVYLDICSQYLTLLMLRKGRVTCFFLGTGLTNLVHDNRSSGIDSIKGQCTRYEAPSCCAAIRVTAVTLFYR